MEATKFEAIIDAHRAALHATRASEPVPKLPHIDDPRFVTEHVGKHIRSIIEVVAFRDFIDEPCYRALYAPEQTSFSLLTGGWFVGPQGNYVEIDGFRDTIPVPDATAFAHRLRRDKSLLFGEDDNELLVGCCALRPGSGGEMKPDDLILLNTFFNHPFHLYVMIDGGLDSVAFYARNAAGRFINVPVTLLAPKEDEQTERVAAPLDPGAKINDGAAAIPARAIEDLGAPRHDAQSDRDEDGE